VLAQERLPIAIGIGDAQGARAGCHQGRNGLGGDVAGRARLPERRRRRCRRGEQAVGIGIAFMRLIWVGE
jgi:hypothetical protein